MDAHCLVFEVAVFLILQWLMGRPEPRQFDRRRLSVINWMTAALMLAMFTFLVVVLTLESQHIAASR